MLDVARLRSDTNKLGYAVQLTTVRFLGVFLTDCDETPDVVVRFVAAQLAVEADAFKPYAEAKIRFEHTATIRDRYGYEPYGSGATHAAFLRWLWRRAWTTQEAPSQLLDRATAWLVEHRVL